MTTDQIVYAVFGVVVVTALILDLGFLSKKNKTITIKQALLQPHALAKARDKLDRYKLEPN